jgi:hypothetical protein
LEPFFFSSAPIIFSRFALIFDKCSILEQTIWPSNQTSHTKVYFNEFVANVLRDNMGMVIFDLKGCGGFLRPKTSYLDTAPILLTKHSIRNEIIYDFQPPYLEF